MARARAPPRACGWRPRRSELHPRPGSGRAAPAPTPGRPPPSAPVSPSRRGRGARPPHPPRPRMPSSARHRIAPPGGACVRHLHQHHLGGAEEPFGGDAVREVARHHLVGGHRRRARRTETASSDATTAAAERPRPAAVRSRPILMSSRRAPARPPRARTSTSTQAPSRRPSSTEPLLPARSQRRAVTNGPLVAALDGGDRDGDHRRTALDQDRALDAHAGSHRAGVGFRDRELQPDHLPRVLIRATLDRLLQRGDGGAAAPVEGRPPGRAPRRGRARAIRRRPRAPRRRPPSPRARGSRSRCSPRHAMSPRRFFSPCVAGALVHHHAGALGAHRHRLDAPLDLRHLLRRPRALRFERLDLGPRALVQIGQARFAIARAPARRARARWPPSRARAAR